MFQPVELFYSIVSSNLTIDLSSNQISFVDLRFVEVYIKSQDEPKRPYYSFSHSGFKNKIILDSNPLSCNCTNFDLISFLTKNMHADVYNRLEIETNDVFCGEVNIKEMLLQSVHCNVDEKCPQRCSCTYWPSTRQISVNCSSAHLSEMPQVLPESYLGSSKEINIQLILRNNSILHFLENPAEVYGRVTELDLSNNRLTYVNSMWTHLHRLKVSIFMSLRRYANLQ